jgi:fatty-acyl-CoA synthase
LQNLASLTKCGDGEGPTAALGDWREIRPARSVHAMLSAVWSIEGDRVAVTMIPTGNPADGDIRVTRGELLARVNRAANLFASLGVGPSDAVATLLPSGIDALVALYGAQAAGIATPLNPLLRLSELEHLLRLSGARVLVASSDPAIGVWQTARELAARIPGLRLFSAGPATPDADDFDVACTGQDGSRLAFARDIEPSDIAAYMHTGGTTGMPKLARISHDAFIYGAWAQARCWEFGPKDVVLSALPLFHVSGLATLGNVPLAAGAEIVFLSPTGFRNPAIVANFWRIVERYRGSFSAFVPTIAATLCGVPTGGAELSSLRTIMIGGSAPPVDTLQRLAAHVPARVVVTFGQTECIVGTGNLPGQAIDAMSSGQALPFMQAVIRDLQSGRDLPPGVPGAILLSGPAAFSGYKGLPPGEGRTPDGKVITGDVGWIDGNGMLFVTGRSKDLIIRSGHNIDPRSIEEACASHPAVAGCAAVGAPDRYAGELPVLYVTLIDRAEATPEELLAWVAERVPERPAAPKTVTILPALPVTAVGKIYKPALRLHAAKQVARRELAGPLSDGAIRAIKAKSDDRLGIVIEIEPANADEAETVLKRAMDALAGLVLHPRLADAPTAAPTEA